MRTLRQVNIKNRQSYFFNSMINIKNFDPNLLNIDKYHLKKITDCVIKYFKKDNVRIQFNPSTQTTIYL